ncbi:MAG: sugar ABC transporter ATP-binding protein [Caldicoprobacterales bacterium]
MDHDSFVQLQHVSKTFPGVKALDDVSFNINTGEVLGLVGENGAGKSTLIKILSGVHAPDPGSNIIVNGKPVTNITPKDSLEMGIVVIYQDFSLFPNLTVRENIAISDHIEKNRKTVNWKSMDVIARRALSELGVDIDPGVKLGTLSAAKQELVAIAKALVYDAKLIIMDEPTSSLSKGEVDVLFKIIRQLRDRGIGVVFVTHKLEELFVVCDRITVLRDGRLVGTYQACEVNQDKLVSLMVGRSVSFERMEGKNFGDEVLRVEHISLAGNFEDISFSLRKGEILGITGLVGAGRTETVRALFGLNRPTSGSIYLEGKKIMPRNPQEAKEMGIAYIPESRQTEGLILRQNVASNITLPIIKKFERKPGLINFKGLFEAAKEWIANLDVRPNYPDMLASKLSGGNQQKVVVAKWLSTKPKVLIIDEPTNGIDVGAKREIHQLLRSLADDGIGIIMVSSELPEVLAISDRILVMRQGRIVAEFDGKEATQESIMNQAVPKGKVAGGVI